MLAALIKSNMRCIETMKKDLHSLLLPVIKSNMRCIETSCTFQNVSIQEIDKE